MLIRIILMQFLQNIQENIFIIELKENISFFCYVHCCKI